MRKKGFQGEGPQTIYPFLDGKIVKGPNDFLAQISKGSHGERPNLIFQGNR
jgi:hypothetical protein